MAEVPSDENIKRVEQIPAGGGKRILNARRDSPDIRDRMYEPALIQLKPQIDHRNLAMVLDQGQEGSCTGHGLSAVINILGKMPGRDGFQASSRMLYEMAQMHDEWPGGDYEGSSCRGAIRGWKNMGVCSEEDWPYIDGDPGEFTIDRARAARRNTLGAYYRLRPEITDYHAALNEVGAVYVSALVHRGWFEPQERSRNGDLAEIIPGQAPAGGHAFAIVGYNHEGFIVQNSWSRAWGTDGFALWHYKDWVESVSDGWVFRLALPVPQIFGMHPRSAVTGGAEAKKRAPKRLEIAGHFVHFDDGFYKQKGDYWTTREDVENTADRIVKTVTGGNENGKYKSLLIFAHGGLNPPKASARRIAALKDGFKRNGVYPFHIMYDTGLVEEALDTVRRAARDSESRAEGFLDWVADKITDMTDKLIETAVRKPVTAIWDEMKRDARLPFEENGDGVHTIATFAQKLAATGLEVHLAGHSTGAVVLGHLLGALDGLGVDNLIKSCNLMAPACSLDFYEEHYKWRLGEGEKTRLPALNIYNLNEELELDDNVALAYRKSLLYLVSEALERRRSMPILGMQLHSKNVVGPNFIYSNGSSGKTLSTSHGGFDNDIHTMNAILETVLGAPPEHPFLKSEMEGY